MDQPDPTQAASLDDLAWCLRHLRTLADTPTYRELERRTVHAEGMLPGTDLRRIPLKRATIADVLSGQAFPRKAFLLTFAEACGVDLRTDHRWEQAWNRLAVRYQGQPGSGGPVPEHPAAAVQRPDSDEPGRDQAAADFEVRPWRLTELLEAADAASASARSLLGRLAQREIERLTSFMRQLPHGREITYDGEDREWLLGLTQEAMHSIDAISLSSVDGTGHGFDGGLWVSDLGVHYLELQRQAVDRGVSVRRIFIAEDENLARNEFFLRIKQTQHSVGIHVRMLDMSRIPDWLHGIISDFIIFDEQVGYEIMMGNAGGVLSSLDLRPTSVWTMLVQTPSHLKDLKNRFEQLWAAADPDRQIGD